MSPINTFHNCGSSSIEEVRKIRPSGVTRGSCRILKIGPTGFVLIFELGHQIGSVRHHAAELVHAKQTAAMAISFLGEKDWARCWLL